MDLEQNMWELHGITVGIEDAVRKRIKSRTSDVIGTDTSDAKSNMLFHSPERVLSSGIGGFGP